MRKKREREGGSEREAAFAGNVIDKARSGEINTLQPRLSFYCTILTLDASPAQRTDLISIIFTRLIHPCEIMSRSAQIQPAR